MVICGGGKYALALVPEIVKEAVIEGTPNDVKPGIVCTLKYFTRSEFVKVFTLDPAN